MSRTIAIHHDYVRHKNGEEQSFSRRWKELAADHGFAVRDVDSGSAEFFHLLKGCAGLMWRFGYDPLSLQRAKRILPAVEHGMGIPVFPSWRTAWHFEDKISQHYLLAAAGIPTPRTWVWWSRPDAERFCREASYPLVAKLACGFQASNVRLLRTPQEALALVTQAFRGGLTSLGSTAGNLRRAAGDRIQAIRLLAGKPLPRGLQHGYVYLQEFLPGNEYDTRVTVIGNRAFAFRRLNRQDDFRASGSGRIVWDPNGIDTRMLRLGFRIARQLGTQSVAIDGLIKGGDVVVCEISYTYASWAVRDCPGHWVLRGEDPLDSEISWSEGQMSPEDAIFLDFVRHLQTPPNRPRDVASHAIETGIRSSGATNT